MYLSFQNPNILILFVFFVNVWNVVPDKNNTGWKDSVLVWKSRVSHWKYLACYDVNVFEFWKDLKRLNVLTCFHLLLLLLHCYGRNKCQDFLMSSDTSFVEMCIIFPLYISLNINHIEKCFKWKLQILLRSIFYFMYQLFAKWLLSFFSFFC